MYPACNNISRCRGSIDDCALNGGVVVTCDISFTPTFCVNSIGAVGGGVSICVGTNAQGDMCYKGIIGCSATLPYTPPGDN
jgi:hypothetical protein